jgi:hypothetical protein
VCVPDFFEESAWNHTVGCLYLPLILYQGCLNSAKRSRVRHPPSPNIRSSFAINNPLIIQQCASAILSRSVTMCTTAN